MGGGVVVVVDKGAGERGILGGDSGQWRCQGCV